MGIPPNGTFEYLWKLTTDDGPLEGDPQCLTQLYQSTVSPERDLISGLVGTLLICKYEAINRKGQLVRRRNSAWPNFLKDVTNDIHIYVYSVLYETDFL